MLRSLLFPALALSGVAAATTVHGSVSASSGIVSRSTRSSSAPSPTGSSSSAGTCPSVSTTTRTRTVTYFVSTGTTTDSSTATVYTYLSSTTITTSLYISYDIEVSSETVTTTFPQTTTTVYEVIPASTSITVPTVAGFTPVKCLAAYSNPLESKIVTSGYDEYAPQETSTITEEYLTDYYYSSTTSIVNTITRDGTETTFYFPPTLTVTSTRADATATVYAACAADNVTPDFPNGRYQYVGTVDADFSVTRQRLPAIDAVDCCSICQSDSSCTGSAFYIGRVVDPCTIYKRNATGVDTCDPRFSNVNVYDGYPTPIITISNGPCGQLGFPWFGI